MASVMNKIKDFFIRMHFGKAVCVAFALAMALSLSACDAPETDPNEKVEFQNTAASCVTCPLFTMVSDAGLTLRTQMIQKTAKPAMQVVGVGFALWLALFVMKFVGSLKEPDIAGFWNGLGIRTFWVVLICAALSANVADAITYIIDPVCSAFIDVAMLALSRMPASPVSCSSSTNPGEGMACVVQAASNAFAVGPSTMTALLNNLFTNPLALFSGCISIIVSYLIILIVPLYLLESVFCYFVILALLPMWVAAYAFPITRQFTATAWNSLVIVFIQMLGMAIFLGLSANIFQILRADMLSVSSVSDPLSAVSQPLMFIFVCYFIYLFGGLMPSIMNVIFSGAVGGVSGQTGGTVKAIKAKFDGKLKGAAENLEGKTFGNSRDDAVKSKTGRENIDPNSHMGNASRHLNRLQNEQENTGEKEQRNEQESAPQTQSSQTAQSQPDQQQDSQPQQQQNQQQNQQQEQPPSQPQEPAESNNE